MAPDLNEDTLLDENNYIIIKGRFKSSSLNLYGLLLVVFNQDGDVDSYNIVVSTFSSLYDIEPHLTWDRYEEAILNAKWKGNFNSSMTASLMDQIKAIATEDNLRSQLFDSIDNYDYDNVEIFMFDIIYHIIHDKNLILEIGIQEISPQEFREAKENRLKSEGAPAPAAKKRYAIEEGAVILSLQPIVAPVKGKPLYELKIGDRIMAKLLPNSDRDNYFIDLLDLRVEDHIRPVSCEVIDIKANSKNDPIEILTQIGPAIYGKIIEEERQVKLRMYDPATDGPISKKNLPDIRSIPSIPGQASDDTGLPKIVYAIMGLFALVLMIFIILIYISF